jgi:hypothetical protein
LYFCRCHFFKKKNIFFIFIGRKSPSRDKKGSKTRRRVKLFGGGADLSRVEELQLHLNLQLAFERHQKSQSGA